MAAQENKLLPQNYGRTIIDSFFKEKSLAEEHLRSFNEFIDWRLQKIVDETKSVSPAVIPLENETVRFVFGKIRVGKPIFEEPDGTVREVYPTEARLRNLTYSAPVYLEVTLMVDEREKERAEIRIMNLPVMIKSKYCNLHGLDAKKLIEVGEDPYDPGGYFIIGGIERSLTGTEDLSSNTAFVEIPSTGIATHAIRLLSDDNVKKIPHVIERNKEGLFLISFSNLKRIPFVTLLKALNVNNSSDIINMVDVGMTDDLYLNLYDSSQLQKQEQALEEIAKVMHLTLEEEQRYYKVLSTLDNIFLPHLGTTPENRIKKAHYLSRLVKRIILFKQNKIPEDDRDHLMNKRIRLSGDLTDELIRMNFRIFVSDMLYIFQRGVRRGKIFPLRTTIRSSLLTARIQSAMGTGNWMNRRTGVSKRLDRDNPITTLSDLTRVTSSLSTSRENFEARSLHATHWGRYCPIETPEGKPIGLRKNLSLLAEVTPLLREESKSKVLALLKHKGLKDFTH